MKQIKIGLFFLMLITILTGCIKIPIGDGNSLKLSKDGLTVSDTDGKETTINIDKDDESFSLTLDGEEEWEGSFGENVTIPEEFPIKDLPIPDGANIISAQKMSLEEGNGSIIIYTYEGEIESLSKLYVDNFKQNSFEEVEEASLGDVGFASISTQKNTNTYIVQMIADDSHIQVSLMFGEFKE